MPYPSKRADASGEVFPLLGNQGVNTLQERRRHQKASARAVFDHDPTKVGPIGKDGGVATERAAASREFREARRSVRWRFAVSTRCAATVCATCARSMRSSALSWSVRLRHAIWNFAVLEYDVAAGLDGLGAGEIVRFRKKLAYPYPGLSRPLCQ